MDKLPERGPLPISLEEARGKLKFLLDVLDGCSATTRNLDQGRAERRKSGHPMNLAELENVGAQTFDAEFGAKLTMDDHINFLNQVAIQLL